MSHRIQKKQVASVSFTGTGDGKLDESDLDADEHDLGDHYLYGSGENKKDYSYPVVSADNVLKRGNVKSAWEMGCRGQCPSEDTHDKKLKKLNQEFDNPPIDDSDADEDKTVTVDQLRDASPSGEFRKDVRFEKVDDDERIARGAVMVPNELDLQGDFVRPDTIADLRENFTERVESGDALPGVMHAVFPDDGVELHEEYQLEESQAIGDEVYPAGTWVAAWQFPGDELWELVDDGVLRGNSIGGTAKGTIYEPGTLPDDVEIPKAVQERLDEAGLTRDDIVAREITQGRILEVSNVDFPAVPRATHQAAKTEMPLSKAHPALTDNVVSARLALEARGHSEADARRLAEYLQEHKAHEEGGLIARAKQWAGLGGGDDGHDASSTTKDGRTLSAANVASAKAVHDAAIDMLDRSDVDHSKDRFSDDPNDNFDIGSYGTRQESSETRGAESPAGGRNSSNEDTMDDETKSLLNDFDERIERIEQAVIGDDGGEGEQDEKSESEGEGEGEGDDPSETEQAIKQLAENQTQMAEQIEQMASAQGVSQQGDVSSTGTDEEKGVWNDSPFAVGGGD